MCDCEEEQQRRQEEEREKERLRNQLLRDKSGPGRGATGPGQGSADMDPCCEDASNCGFFTCGLGSGSGNGGGSWLPLAGSALLLAMMAYLFKYLSKMLLGNKKDDKGKKDTSAIDRDGVKSKAGRRVSFECPARK